MSAEQTRLNDGFTSLVQGMDGGEATNLLPRTKYANGLNVTVRGGYPDNRPDYNQFPLNFTSQNDETIYTTGRFQGGQWFVDDAGATFGMASVSGNIFRLLIGQNQITVENLTLPSDPNMSTLPMVWMEQAEQYVIIQDGIDAALIYDGATLRRSRPYSPFYEVPTGTVMAYGQGRLFITRGKNFEAGDIVGGATDVIVFKEVRKYQDSFAVPIPSGNITAMIFSSQIDTALGQGQLEVHTESGDIISVDVTTDRQSWTTSSIQSIGLRGGAATGARALVNVNNDTWFRSRDGIRSFVIANRLFGTWGNTPQSREVSNILAYDSFPALQFTSAVWFDNRLLVTVNPQAAGKANYFQGMVALDFDLLSSVGATSIYNGLQQTPAWEGLWEGVNICQVTKAYSGSKERCFLFTNDPVEGNGIWEISTTADSTGFDNICCPIYSFVATGSMNFGALTQTKKLIAGDLWYDQRLGGVLFKFEFKPEQYPFWLPWGYFDVPDENPCNVPVATVGCQSPVTKQLLYGSSMRVGEMDYQNDNPLVDYPLDFAYDFQFKISWTGKARIKGWRVHAFVQDDESTGGQTPVLSGPCPDAPPANAYEADSIPGPVSFAAARLATTTTRRFTVSDIGSVYTATVIPSTAGAIKGDVQRLVFVMPASTNPTINITAATTATVTGTGSAFTTIVIVSFDGSRWNLDGQR